MKKFILVLSIFFSAHAFSQEVKIIKADDLQELMLSAENSLTVFNFWATWCAPCIKELPHFEEINQKENVKVYLVSLDFQNQLERVKKFVTNKSLQSEVLFLDEKNPEEYMMKVSGEWTGAIPATLFVTDLGRTYFYESAFSKADLEKTVNKHLN